MVLFAQMMEFRWRGLDICNFNVFASLFISSLAGLMCFTLKLEELNGAMKFILKRKKKKKIELFNYYKFNLNFLLIKSCKFKFFIILSIH